MAKVKRKEEPLKPVSAYALFFKDTQGSIKTENPNVSFKEVSQIVTSMWVSLNTETKNTYKQKYEEATKIYYGKLEENHPSDTSNGEGNANCLTKNKQNGNNLPSTSKQLSSPQSPAQQQLNSNSSENFPQHCLPSYNNLQKSPDLDKQISGPQPQTPVNRQLYNGAICLRTECNNPAVINPEWEDEYCSNECVVTHTRDVFRKWVENKQKST